VGFGLLAITSGEPKTITTIMKLVGVMLPPMITQR
jgi:hypothetical protein